MLAAVVSDLQSYNLALGLAIEPAVQPCDHLVNGTRVVIRIRVIKAKRGANLVVLTTAIRLAKQLQLIVIGNHRF